MSAPAHIARENGKKGGRPKGRKNDKTIERELVLAEMKDRIGKIAQRLLDAQVSIATGQQFLYKIHTNKKGIKEKPELITDTSTIEAYLNGELNSDMEAKGGEESDDYYYITTKEPSNYALDSLFDRTFGKARQGEVDINVRLPKPILDVYSNDSDEENKELNKKD